MYTPKIITSAIASILSSFPTYDDLIGYWSGIGGRIAHTRRLAQYVRNAQHKIVDDITVGRQFAIFEIPYDQPEFAANFVGTLRQLFPDHMDLHVFVNHGNGGAHECFVAAGFMETLWPHTSRTINAIAGVTRTFTKSAPMLTTLAAYGMYDVALHAYPTMVLELYARNFDAS